MNILPKRNLFVSQGFTVFHNVYINQTIKLCALNRDNCSLDPSVKEIPLGGEVTISTCGLLWGRWEGHRLWHQDASFCPLLAGGPQAVLVKDSFIHSLIKWQYYNNLLIFIRAFWEWEGHVSAEHGAWYRDLHLINGSYHHNPSITFINHKLK